MQVFLTLHGSPWTHGNGSHRLKPTKSHVSLPWPSPTFPSSACRCPWWPRFRSWQTDPHVKCVAQQEALPEKDEMCNLAWPGTSSKLACIMMVRFPLEICCNLRRKPPGMPAWKTHFTSNAHLQAIRSVWNSALGIT